MYDRNGLELSPVSHTLNSYKYTAVQLKINRYNATAKMSYRTQNEWTLLNIGTYKDPRDAAYVAQEFAKEYDGEFIRTLHTDGEWAEFARNYRENIEIPEWDFPPEGLLIEDILGETGYEKNRVEGPREALVEALKVFEKKPPSLKEVPTLVKKVEEKYNNGMSYRAAAKEVAATL